MVPLYQSVLSGLLIGLKGEIGGSLRVYYNKTKIQKGLGYKSLRQVCFDYYRQAA